MILMMKTFYFTKIWLFMKIDAILNGKYSAFLAAFGMDLMKVILFR